MTTVLPTLALNTWLPLQFLYAFDNVPKGVGNNIPVGNAGSATVRLEGKSTMQLASHQLPITVPAGYFIGVRHGHLSSKGSGLGRNAMLVIQSIGLATDAFDFAPPWPVLMFAGRTLAATCVNNEDFSQNMTCLIQAVLIRSDRKQDDYAFVLKECGLL